MSGFVTGVADLVKEECRMAMLRDDMHLSRLMVYSQFIEESKLSRIASNLKRSGSSEKNQPRFKRGLQFKINVVLLRSKLRRIVVLKMVRLLVLFVERSTMGIV